MSARRTAVSITPASARSGRAGGLGEVLVADSAVPGPRRKVVAMPLAASDTAVATILACVAAAIVIAPESPARGVAGSTKTSHLSAKLGPADAARARNSPGPGPRN